jgi:hypothetical protein
MTCLQLLLFLNGVQGLCFVGNRSFGENLVEAVAELVFFLGYGHSEFHLRVGWRSFLPRPE